MCLCLHVHFCLIQQETTSSASWWCWESPELEEPGPHGGPAPLRGADRTSAPVTAAQTRICLAVAHTLRGSWLIRAYACNRLLSIGDAW